MGFFSGSRSSSGSSSSNSNSNTNSNSNGNSNGNSNSNSGSNSNSTAENPSVKRSKRPFGFPFSRSNGSASSDDSKHSRSSSLSSDSSSTSFASSSGCSGSASFAGEASEATSSRLAACDDRDARLRLPPAVFACISTQLRALYTNANANGEACETCIVRDLAAAARTCRSWRDGLVPVIYRDIYITGDDSPAMRKKVRAKIAHGGRILLLQRTLAARPDYASHVRLLTLPEYSPTAMAVKGREQQRQAVEATVAALIASCPNVESVHGVYVPFTGTTHSPVHAALATRPALREHLWLVGATVPLRYTDSQAFVGLHLQWRNLETLVMQGHTASHGGGGLNHLTFTDIFAHLPSLRRLMVSRFHAYEFGDSTLLAALAAPSLTHLRLGELPGVTEDGLVASSLLAPALRTLALIELDIRSLATVAALLANLRLRNLTLLQTASPEPAAGAPALASPVLQSLHWDFLTPGPATVALAESIRTGQFPALRRLRAPADHSGILQAVCQPRDRILHPLDPSLVLAAAAAAAAAASASVGAFSPSSSYSRLLPRARVEAERRIVQARAGSTSTLTTTTITTTTAATAAATTATTLPPPPPPPAAAAVGVANDGGYDWMGWNGSARRWKIEQELRSKEGGGGVLGDPRSRVLYHLEPDVEGSVDAICHVRDVVARFGATARSWCQGGGGGSGGGAALRRWHQNRGRRRLEEGALGLGILF